MAGRRVERSKPVIDTNVNVRVKKDKEEKQKHYCTCCGKSWTKQSGNFSKSSSSLFVSNGGHIPVCRSCVDKYYESLVELYSGSEEKAIERICQIFDWFFDEDAFKSSKTSDSSARVGSYISKMNLAQTRAKGSTYVDTIKIKFIEENNVINSPEDVKNSKSEVKVTQKMVKFWGTGFELEEYRYLQDQYDEWVTRNECKTKAQEELFKAVSFSQLNILKAQQTNGKVNEAMKSFQDLLGSANLKPNQTSDNALADQNTFGTLIQKWEVEKPIPEPDPEWKDVDGIAHYITVFFLGHLCKMLGIKNSYSAEYEKEMAKYRVEKPEYFEDDEVDFDNIFGGVENG